ncbi:MAG: DUF192 domain-containing protein [Methanobacteriaceae archaeon]|nr:DUF192 domain-containing protein [Methanobacteriaceae archaeon]
MLEKKLIIKEKIIKLNYTNTFLKRLKGLMFKKEINQGLIFINKKPKNKYQSTIHTHFMKINIDIIFLDENMKLIDYTTLNPWKIYIPKKDEIKYIIELPQNTIEKEELLKNKIKIE